MAQGQLSLPEAMVQTQIATRRYAKRQMTWFRHEADINWFGGFGDDLLDPKSGHQLPATEMGIAGRR